MSFGRKRYFKAMSGKRFYVCEMTQLKRRSEIWHVTSKVPHSFVAQCVWLKFDTIL